MARNKNDKELRRKVEILKAQLSTSKEVFIPKKDQAKTKTTKQSYTIEDKEVLKTNTHLIKKDLYKTLLLSLLAFSIIFTLAIV